MTTETPVVKVAKTKVAKQPVQPKVIAAPKPVQSSSLVIPRKECKGCASIGVENEKKYVCSHPKRKGGKAYMSMKHILGERWNKEGNFTLTAKAEDINTDAFKTCSLLKA